MSNNEQGAVEQQRDALVDKLVESVGGAFNIYTVYIGDKLGLYDILAQGGAMTSSELANQANCNERYIREWLEQQTVSGILEVKDERMAADKRKYRLPIGHVEVLTDRESLNYVAPLAQLFVGVANPKEALLNAFRNGGGVTLDEYGDDFREGQANINRPSFLHLMGTEWLPSIPQLHQRLQSDPPARVADVGCGAGWSSIGIAQAYPKTFVDGFDLDAPYIEQAKGFAEEHGVADRVNFQVRDAGDPTLAGQYDLVTAFECIHDMSNPVDALSVMRNLAGENGKVLVVDERVGDTFTATGNDVEWMMYGLECVTLFACRYG